MYMYMYVIQLHVHVDRVQKGHCSQSLETYIAQARYNRILIKMVNIFFFV